MASRKILFCLLLFIFAVSVIKCKGGRSGGGSRGGSSSGGGWSSHSSSSYSKPSWSSGSSSSWSSGSYKSSWSSSSSGHSYPSSSSGLSGSGYKPSHSSSSYGYPSSSSGLSGSGSSSYGYPSSSSGLSGYGSGKSSYPSSSSGLSGSGSGKSSYPSSSSGSYNFGWGVRNPSSGKNNYPSYGNGNSYYTPSSTGQSYGNGYYKTYYSAPQHVYINQYRNSDSRYRHLLSGLALYNIGRSHSYHHEHYYYDDFYSRKYHPTDNNNGYNSYSTPQETATCRLKVTDRYFTETINIPCEIVSTFTEDSKMVSEEDRDKTIVCVNKTITVYVKDNSTSVLSNPTAERKEKVITNCKSTATSVDPFSVHGPSLAHYGKDCTIEIQKKDILLHNSIDCTILLDYDQMPQPTIQESSIMPSREKLKSWVSNPPWWMSLFIAV